MVISKIMHNSGFTMHPEWLEYSLMVRWVVGSILRGGPIELFLIPASALQLV